MLPVKKCHFIQINRSRDLQSRHWLVQNVVWKYTVILPDKVCLCFNFGVTLKISPSFCSILLKKKCVPTEVHLMLFKIVD